MANQSSQTRRGRSTVAGIAALMTLATGCCAGGSEYLTFGIGGAGVTTPRWGETMSCCGQDRGAAITVHFPEHEMLKGEPIEFYDQDSERRDVPATEEVIDNSTRNGCGTSRVLTYRLKALPVGTYWVVHRRGSGTGDPINCLNNDCPWELFDGDEALVMVLEWQGSPALRSAGSLWNSSIRSLRHQASR